ncbi:diguanylate cyclase domain-containing protein [Microbacterium aureliae]
MPDLPTVSYEEGRIRDAAELRRLQECAAEPLRTVGRIQSHGTLFAVDPVSGLVVAASEDAEEWLGRDLREAGSDMMTWALTHGIAVDPVRAEFEGGEYDVIVHRETTPMIIELEPVLPDLDYVRTGVVSAIQRLAAITDPDQLRRRAAWEIKQITGFDRVMCYHFHDDGHGQIVADEREEDMEPYFGLHFPSSDIPPQARALYLEKRSRVIFDTEDAGLPIRTLLPEDAPLDLGGTELRAVSPHHLQFMRNMGQASTVSFAIVAGDQLVGMFTCAHRTLRRLPVLLRRALEVLAAQVAMQLVSANQIHDLRRQLEARERRAAVVAPLYGRAEIADVLIGGRRTVLDAIPADGVYLRVDGAVSTLGVVPPPERLGAVVDDLGPGSYASDALPIERPELAVEIAGVAGLIVVPLSDTGDRLVFVRGEVAHEVEWLGDQTGDNRDTPLSPRRSFSAWRESVTGRSMPWGPYAQDAFDLGSDIRAALVARAQAELADLALHDALTGLHNRRYLDERLDQVLAKAPQRVSAIFLDLDNFKQVNDTHGHELGDAVLTTVAQRLAGSARASDIVVRLGGDEFVIVCLDISYAEATTIAERALGALAQPIAVDHRTVEVSASAGVVTETERTTASRLIDAADAAMYRAKRSGRGRVSG